MGLTQGAQAVLLELLQARDQAKVVDDTSWHRNEWAAAVSRMTVTAFEAAREVRAEVGKTKGAPTERFGTPWAKIPKLLGRALGAAIKAWLSGDRLEFASRLMVMGAQILLLVEELPIWMPPEAGLVEETRKVKEYVHSLTQRETYRSHLN